MNKCDVYNFYQEGYSVGITPSEVYRHGIDYIEQHEDFDGFCQAFDIEDYYTELMFERYTYDQAPLQLKYMAQAFLSSGYLKPLQEKLIRSQHKDQSWTKRIVPVSYSCFDRRSYLPPHSDSAESADFFCLFYFTEQWNEKWGGQVLLGHEDGDVFHEHYPYDQSFLMINCQNPYFTHEVAPVTEDVPRKVISISFRIE